VFSSYVLFPVYPWIMLIQIGRGFSFGMFVGTSMTYATEVTTQAERGRASGLYSSTRGLGSVLGGAVGGSLTQFLGFRFMLFTCAILVFGGAVYVATTYLRWRGATVQAPDPASS
jgi:MFS family permease